MSLSLTLFTYFLVSVYPFYVSAHYLQHKKLKKKPKRNLKLLSYFSLVSFTLYSTKLLFQLDLTLPPSENVELLTGLSSLTQVLLFGFITLGLAELLERKIPRLTKVPVETKNPRNTHGI